MSHPRLLGALAAASAVFVSLALVAAPAQAATTGTGTVTGVVTDAVTGAPLRGIDVLLAGFPFESEAVTGVGGTFVFDDVTAGSGYTILASDDIATQYLSKEVSLSVHAGRTTTIDLGLKLGGVITGTVTSARTGKPVAEALVLAMPVASSFNAATVSAKESLNLISTTDSAGHYSLSGLLTGDYRIFFAPLTGGLAEEWLGNHLGYSTAASVHAAAAQTTAHTDIALPTAATLSGKVTSTGKISDEEQVEVYGLENGQWIDTGEGFGNTAVDSHGDYEVDGLPAGQYRVEFSDASGHSNSLQTEFYRAHAALSGATTVTLTAGESKKLSPMKLFAKQELTRFSRTAHPSIHGSRTSGGVLTVTHSGWSPAPQQIGYQWRRDGKAIRGAVYSAYRPTAADIGHRISVTETAHSAGLATTARTSASTAKISRG